MDEATEYAREATQDGPPDPITTDYAELSGGI